MISYKSGSKAIGLDIGTFSIKVTVLDVISGEKVLTNYMIKSIPPESKSAQKEKLIKEIFKDIDVIPEAVNVSVSGPDVIVRFIDLPNMTMDQLTNALVFEAEKYIPFNVNEVILDSLILGEGAESGQMRVLLAAAKKEPIVNLAKTMEGMGIGINCIDIDTFAMFNTYLNTLDSPLEESAAFLLMGHSTTDILISSGSQPCFMRQIQIAGKDITESISKNCSLSADEAGNLKQKTDTGNKDKVTQAISSVLEDLVREMQLSFGYFENRYNKSIKSIFCSGGMIYQEGVLDCLSSRLGAEFKKWDPFKGIKLAETVSKKEIDDVSGLLTVSLGLALRG